MSDDTPTWPGDRALPTRQCPVCLKQASNHDPHCIVSADQRRVRRELEAKAHFMSMTKMQVVLSLAVGAYQRGATFHFRGKLP